MKQTKPFGSWESPITAQEVAAAGVSLSEPRCDDGLNYWLERRPLEKGRSVIVCRDRNGDTRDVTDVSINVRTRANEYGGGAYAVANDEVVCVNDIDQRVYRIGPNGDEAVTPDGAGNFADLMLAGTCDGVFAVREQHVLDSEAINTLVHIGIDGSITTLADGADFYASPRLSPDGKRLAWLQWQHPNMPWDGTELWLADFETDTKSCRNARCIAGGQDESVFQPEFAPDGRLYFVSDRSDWWNLYRFAEDQIESVCSLDAEFGLPQWVFGMRTYAIRHADEAICLSTSGGLWKAARLCLNTGELTALRLPMTDFNGIDCAADGALMVAASPTSASAVIHYDLGDNTATSLSADASPLDKAYLSEPKAVDFPSEECAIRHALFYPPNNPGYQGPEGTSPPVIIKIHGGPTAQTGTGLSPAIQFWTSRGFALLDVNYGGSTGYGRRYRNALRGQWGEMDLDDCVNAVLWAASEGLVDKDKAIIRGSSAGGYTTLAALTFRDIFKAGASYYGISDLEALTAETHKFESRYTDRLIGPYPARKALYEKRSPIHHAERLNAPVIFFQGLEDKVVPPNQAQMMAEVLDNKKLPVAHLEFEGEGHGFRQADTVIRTLEAELHFYGRVFGFEPADSIEPVEIRNLP